VTFRRGMKKFLPKSRRRRAETSSSSPPHFENLIAEKKLTPSVVQQVSEISHINELRREVSGMEHLDSEYYEIKRENPDAISLDSIHKTIFRRCQNKYIPPQRSSAQNKCFVLVTSGFTLVGIIYGFWYKNFGPGAADLAGEGDHH